MTHTITINNDNTVTLKISFLDETVNLEGTTVVKGVRADAERYLPVFEADLRRNYAHLFPAPVVPVTGGMMR